MVAIFVFTGKVVLGVLVAVIGGLVGMVMDVWVAVSVI
jgi:hypothetical protein